MRREYELRGGRANPYAQRLGAAGTAEVLERFLRSEHFVRIDEDLLAAIGGESAVNETLRLALKMKEVLSEAATPGSARSRLTRRR